MFPQSTILGPLFWIALGMLYSFLIISARIWVKDLKLKMNKWKWLLLISWFILINLSIAGGFTLIGENEKRAGLYFLGFFGIISTIYGVVIWRILQLNRDKSHEDNEE